MFSVWSERAVERWQGERFEFVRTCRMGQIVFVAILAGVCAYMCLDGKRKRYLEHERCLGL